ncbi:MAG: glutamate--tRNA ligase, partial [Candidatus Korarchaeota archaeon]|nr:glutamate--tRNA ligase [Candidatus Korarchaeota archaeon]
YEVAKEHGTQLIHWLPMGNEIPCCVVMPDASRAEGFTEESCNELRPNEIVQFERFGFVRIDEFNEKLVAYYAHR